MTRRQFAAMAATVALGLGCYPQQTIPINPSNPAADFTKSVDADKNLPKRDPKPSTCVAFGDLELKSALEEMRTPAQKEQGLEYARKYYQQAIKLDSKCTEAYRGLAQTHQEMGSHERAIAAYQSGLKALPKDAGLWYELGMCEARSKEWAPAIEHLEKAVALDPENRTFNSALAFSLARTGRYKESLACFIKAVGEAQAHYNVARMMLHMRDRDGCKNELRLALQADPRFDSAQQLLAKLDAPAGSEASQPARVSTETSNAVNRASDPVPVPAAAELPPLRAPSLRN